MFKKTLVAVAIVAASSTIAMAGAAPYMGAAIGIQDNIGNGYSRLMPANLFAGYGGTIGQSQNVYLAGEVFAVPATYSFKNSGLDRTTYGYGASIIPGLMLSDHTLGYVRAGVVKSRFSHASESVTGGQLGLGLQTSLSQNVDLRGEYVYTAYRSVDRVSSPKADQANLGLIYKFE